MSCNKKNKSRYHNFIIFYMLFNILLLLAGCQTLTPYSAEEKKKAEVLNTQKALIISFLNKGLPGMALKELRKMVKAHPKDADFRNLQGLTYLSLRNPKKAIPIFSKAYKIKSSTSIGLNLSSAYIEAGEYKKAIDFLAKLKKAEETREYAHPERIAHNLALASEKLKRVKSAERFYRQALKYNPHFYISTMRLGQLYDKTKRPKSARLRYLKAKDMCKKCFDPINALAMNYFSRGQVKKSIKLIQEYLNKKDILPHDRFLEL